MIASDVKYIKFRYKLWKGMSSFFGSSSSSTPAVSGTAAAAGTDPSRPFASYVSSS